MQETHVMWVWFLGGEEHLEEEMATHSSILAWEISWAEAPSGVQSMGLQRVRYDLATGQKHMHKKQKTCQGYKSTSCLSNSSSVWQGWD